MSFHIKGITNKFQVKKNFWKTTNWQETKDMSFINVAFNYMSIHINKQLSCLVHCIRTGVITPGTTYTLIQVIFKEKVYMYHNMLSSLTFYFYYFNCGVMVSALGMSVVDCWFKPQSSQTKDYKSVVDCWFKPQSS
jgi:hypothetical protein